MQNKPLFGDVAPLISRFPPTHASRCRRLPHPRPFLVQLLSQLVARFQRPIHAAGWGWSSIGATSRCRIGASSRC